MKVRTVNDVMLEVLSAMQRFNRQRMAWRVTGAEVTLYIHPTPEDARDDRHALLLSDAAQLDASTRVAEFELCPHYLALETDGWALTSFGEAIISVLRERITAWPFPARRSLEPARVTRLSVLLMRFDCEHQNFDIMRQLSDEHFLPHYIVCDLEGAVAEVEHDRSG
jgi:hypothetical protein